MRPPRLPKTPVLPPAGNSSLRLIFEHITGPLAGIHQILGTAPAPYPDMVAIKVLDLPQLVPMNLVRVRRGGVYYRELGISDPNRPKRFDPRQV